MFGFSYIKGKYECGSSVRFRNEIKFASINHDYLFRNEEPLDDLIIYLDIILFNVAISVKQFEYRFLILFLDSYPSIFDYKYKLLLFVIIVNIYKDTSLICISNTVCDQIDCYLHQPLLVPRYKQWQHLIFIYFHNVV